ncbi:MAG: prolyl oligopeptidase family serine peptidase [Enterobacterales bacterium]|nr:prolyl oligopeptidase family serine peptidase [Enterobacterales bacterium]
MALEEISCAQTIGFDSANERKCQAFYYPPKNSRYQAEQQQQPPLIVMSHGGPTAMTNNSLNFAIQFWTHRGFAVVDVNYAGSSGFGKKYRNLLNGQWGIADIEDCIAAAQFLIDTKRADKHSILIRGGSAGGYTTLCGLTFYDFFAAGTSRYGVADLECLASDSHKFEARYLDSLIGPYPQEKDLYQARSPIHHANQLSCPILLLQGADDKVVPPNQAEMMVTALKSKQIPFAYKLYSGEGHGFRKAKSITDALNSELSFYRQVLSIDSDEDIPKLGINYLE